MECLDQSLSEIQKSSPNSRLGLLAILEIADQVMTRLEALHNKCFPYRNRKPSNFVVGRDNPRSIIYLIDFSWCKPFIDPGTNLHIPLRSKYVLLGILDMLMSTHILVMNRVAEMIWKL
jgi:casein kinase 1